MRVTAIIAAAGSGRRLGAPKPKQLLDIGGGTMLHHSVAAFHRHPRVDEIVIVLPKGTAAALPEGVRTAPGGERRQDSVANAFEMVDASTDVVLIHDAARPFVSADLIDRTIDAAAAYGAAIAALQSRDTVKRVEAGGTIVETIPRDTIYLAQTPQGFRRDVLAKAIAIGRAGVEATDEALLAERAGYTVHVVDGDPGNVKITTEEDLAAARARTAAGKPARTGRAGTGYDLHRLVEGRPLVIGGVVIPFDKGPLGHSDGDVACHAATDAILGAAGLGDIATAVGTSADRISVKGKTNEGVDAVGRGEAIAAHAVALIRSRQ
jgi:2-C-methyl-D-erythritol 4-phosphate cytidylyltransferase/2-C-methyl-D-erythritol 2,4-cyclodiphosphate synthase